MSFTWTKKWSVPFSKKVHPSRLQSYPVLSFAFDGGAVFTYGLGSTDYHWCDLSGKMTAFEEGTTPLRAFEDGILCQTPSGVFGVFRGERWENRHVLFCKEDVSDDLPRDPENMYADYPFGELCLERCDETHPFGERVLARRGSAAFFCTDPFRLNEVTTLYEGTNEKLVTFVSSKRACVMGGRLGSMFLREWDEDGNVRAFVPPRRVVLTCRGTLLGRALFHDIKGQSPDPTWVHMGDGRFVKEFFPPRCCFWVTRGTRVYTVGRKDKLECFEVRETPPSLRDLCGFRVSEIVRERMKASMREVLEPLPQECRDAVKSFMTRFTPAHEK